MDFEEFEVDIERAIENSDLSKSCTITETLDWVDSTWYAPESRNARWMDLIGDYAGAEPFVIDGHSLLQVVLDDRLLSLAKDDDPSFQIIHAIYLLEHILQNFRNRSANFDIVFFDVNRHLVLRAGESEFIVASRALARRLLYKHLQSLDSVNTFTFTSLSDKNWLDYRIRVKPMFVMVNDGGTLKEGVGQFAAHQILTQRLFIFDLLASGLAMAPLQGADFKDTKILTFVFESKLRSSQGGHFPNAVLSAGIAARDILANHEQGPFDQVRSCVLGEASVSPSFFDLCATLKDVGLSYLSAFKSNTQPLLLAVFIIHVLLLKNMSVQDRARRLPPMKPDLFTSLTKSFLPHILRAAEAVVVANDASLDIDIRVFLCILRYLSEHPAQSLTEVLGPTVVKDAEDIFSELKLPHLDFSHLSVSFLPDDLYEIPIPLKLLPFSNPVFDEELSAVRIVTEGVTRPHPVEPVASGGEESDEWDDSSTSDESAVVLPSARSSQNKTSKEDTHFSDTQHWHNNKKAIPPKRLGGEATAPMTEWQRNRQRTWKLRSDQRFMKTLHDQASTLTGALGAVLEQVKIPSVASLANQRNVKPKVVHVRSSGKSTSKLSKADAIREQNIAKKESKQVSESAAWIASRIQEMETLDGAGLEKCLEVLARNPRTREASVGAELRVYRMHRLLREWIQSANPDSSATRDKYSLLLMRLVKAVWEIGFSTREMVNAITSVLITLGFSDYIDSLVVSGSADDRPLTFRFVKLVKSKTKTAVYDFMRIQEHPIIWQLRLFGEFMDRSMDSQADARVTFKPDAWQREVLDAVDQNMSLLVVAPTSAGKTFISYYAMEKILRGSDDGILVYIAPTKALVAQVAAEIYARFSKDLNGRSCWAIHSRDYRVHDPQNCQILVTVPEMLAIMLLTPPLAKIWTPRLKYVVLDEIHTIGQQEGGAVWEQILLLCPCPIIGLSATVGAPEKFNEWLESVQKAGGFQHKFVHYPYRYSHLRKFYYNIHEKPRDTFQGLSTYKTTERMRFLHPLSILSSSARSLPSDLALEAVDTLHLYHALSMCNALQPSILAALDPAVFFSSSKPLQQKDVIQYEEALKQHLVPLLSSFDSQDSGTPLSRVIVQLQDDDLSRIPDRVLNSAPSRVVSSDNIIHLVADLHTQGDLPGIFFSFDRTDCEYMAKILNRVLEIKEDKWRQTSPEWKRKMAQYNAYLQNAKERERQAARASKHKADEEDKRADTSEWQASFRPDDPLPDFSFAGQNTSYTASELDEDIVHLGWRTPPIPEWALKCLRRGIAVHHAGMNKGYRAIVESLFRRGFVRVIFATSTLALGINAPTKTSIFCGDSPFLTALMYRQCAGRAGRRGYDTLGKVVFYALPMSKVQRLVLSKLPSLSASFPVTSTLVVRLFNLLEGSNYSTIAVAAVQRLFRLPQISFDSEEGRYQLLHHLRFSIDYLRRARLLDEQGKPLNLFGIAARLYYTEPSNFALVALFRSGVIHKICAQSDVKLAKRDFILLMAHLFGRRYLPPACMKEEYITNVVKKSPSMVVLPPLSKIARDELIYQEREILQIFTGYALTYGTQHQKDLGPDHILPLSKRDISGIAEDEPSLIRHHLHHTAIRVVARSLFVANSGHDDHFSSVHDLAQTARRGLNLNEHTIPSFEGITGRTNQDNRQHALNAYLLDFYMHGQVAALAAANAIRRGDVWYVLEEFDLTLMTVRGVLEQLLQKGSIGGKGATPGNADLDEEADSGYASLDPVQWEDEEEEASGKQGQGGWEFTHDSQRPPGVSGADWRVFEVVNGALEEFHEKFKAMWA
ncbi:uncharacterized protein F5891DRAFT_111844 [Suillus fuscotomentosus]|uniref:P-loop containing nucleoside triphosphate hydrolase protein n=1 Tax=Suillus fuscotomentosus TaxID=1912939 RepID=A0AAD4EBM5_9AGAM|nr:uncharacterized protein F5891DRAFT_111844 [Suillus fuscotomentosus]KAG1903002.1 hypothetical protein F5891DRAFT_111844 [Suillus fuscotomentosus]